MKLNHVVTIRFELRGYLALCLSLRSIEISNATGGSVYITTTTTTTTAAAVDTPATVIIGVVRN